MLFANDKHRPAAIKAIFDNAKNDFGLDWEPSDFHLIPIKTERSVASKRHRKNGIAGLKVVSNGMM